MLLVVKPDVEAKPVKPAEADKASASKSKQSDAGKQKVKIVEPIKDVNSEDDDTSEDAMSEDEDDSEVYIDTKYMSNIFKFISYFCANFAIYALVDYIYFQIVDQQFCSFETFPPYSEHMKFQLDYLKC